MKENTITDGDLFTAKYVSALYVYIQHTQISGPFKMYFQFVEPSGWNWTDTEQTI